MAKYQNAKCGMSKLFTSAILEIIATILASVAISVGLNNSSNNDGVAISAGAVALAAAVVAVIAFIFNLIGLHRAGKDEQNFKGAFDTVIASIIVAVIVGLLSLNQNIAGPVTSFAETISSVFELSIIILVCNGISSIFRAQGKEKLAKRGNTITVFAIIAFVVSIFFRGATLATFAPDQVGNIILVSIGGACEIVGYVMYIVYLYRAKKDF